MIIVATNSFFGDPVKVALIISAIMVVIAIIIAFSRKQEEKKSKQVKGENKSTIKEDDTKKVWSQNFWVGLMPPILIAIFVFASFSGYLPFDYSRLIAISLVTVFLILVLLNSKFDNMFVQTILIVIISILIGLFVGLKWLVPRLVGTPPPIPMLSVDISDGKPIVYDVSNPRWTGISIKIPDDSWLEIRASGRHHFSGESVLSVNDGVTSCGPEGASFPIAYIKGDEIDWKRPHLVHPSDYLLRGAPYAALIGMVGEGEDPFLIGKYRKIFIEDGDDLYISTNIKWERPGSGMWKLNWRKSSGTFNLVIKISPKV